MTTKLKNKNNVILSIAVIVLSIAGYAHTFLGTWTKYAGEAAKFFPRFSYTILILCGIAMLVWELTGKYQEEPKALADLTWYHPLIFVASGVVFFLGAYYVGTYTAIFVFLLSMISAFSSDPKKELAFNLLVAVIASVVIGLVFTYVVPMLTPNQLLF